MYARVALDLPVPTEFTYSVPQALLGKLRPGLRVRVPFRTRTMVGYCVGMQEGSDVEKTRDIAAIVDKEPIVAPDLLDLARWIASYYACSLGEALQAMLPGGVRRGARKERRVHGLPGGEAPRRARKAAAILQAMEGFPGPPTVAELCAAAGCTPAALRTLLKAGLLRVEESEIDEAIEEPAPAAPETPPDLLPAQAEALAAMLPDLLAPRFQVHLLLGVTGSGKTEVYLRAIAETLRCGRQAIVLVPEISLTPQTVRRFRARFPKVAVLHSQQNEAERRQQWKRIRRGDADVVIGPRSAIFAPLARLGLIVVDEEHEGSFKQENPPRYHARDVAVVRARAAGCPVILGSATPSLESFWNARRGRYALHRLPGRAGGFPLPPVQVIDMGMERGLFSRRLQVAVADAVRAGGQVILFLNRRGFATILLCRRCGSRVGCPHCSSTLVFHKGRRRTVCHLCGHEAAMPDACPECHGPGLEMVGSGTERVEEEAALAWPGVPMVRVDSDTARGTKLEEALESFRTGAAKILVGTQMIAKGLHFPQVTLVGIVSADTALHLADFRANERTFSLIAQVAGRAGRGVMGGQVLVQTYTPAHEAVTAAARHDYDGFATRELQDREMLNLPPYRRAALWVLSGENDAATEAAARTLAGLARPVAERHRVEMRGPARAPIQRIRSRYRWMILLLCPTARGIAAVGEVARRHRPRGKVDLAVDVDPSAVL